MNTPKSFYRIHCFDPGDHTGYVIYNLRTKHIETYNIFMEYEDIYKALENIDSTMERVVFENVRGACKNAKEIRMCKKTGFVEGLCECFGIVSYPQIPDIRTGVKPYARQWFKRFYGKRVTSIDDFIMYENHMEHNIDAFAHCLAFLQKNYGRKEIEKYVRLEK